MQLSENQIITLRGKYYEKYGGEKYFPTNEDNPHYEDLEKELLAYVQQTKKDCFVKCTKYCTSSDECRNERNKITRYALSASRKQLSQLLHNYPPIKHDRFYEGFIELCCRFIGIDWDDFKRQPELLSEETTVTKTSEVALQNDEKESDNSSQIHQRKSGETSKDKGEVAKREHFNLSKLNLWKWATIFCITIIAALSYSLNQKKYSQKLTPNTLNREFVDSTFINIFETFHHASVSKDTNVLWQLTTLYWRNSAGRKIIKKDDFNKYYRMTKEHIFKHYLPIELEGDKDSIARFYVWFKFRDEAPYLLKRSSFLKSELSQIDKNGIINDNGS